MKKISTILAIMFLFVFTVSIVSANPASKEKLKGIPDDVKAIIENSCYGCHNSDSRNEDAREELSFDKLEDLSKIKKIGAYKHIGETVKENEMPPKRFLERNPDKKLSDDQKKIIMDWAKKEAESLVKQ